MAETSIAAVCKGVRVPQSPFLTETRIERINAARYEGEEIAGALAVVRPGDRVLEMGAGLGIVGAVMAKNAGPEAVLSFEANPELVPHIRALHGENGLEEVIELRNEVLMSAPERPKSITFHLANSFLGSSLIEKSTRKTRPVDVPTADFHAVVDRFRPNVLIMDIEGGELDLLRHADLRGFRAIVLEFHPGVYGAEGMRECKKVLRQAGFKKDDAVSTRTVWTCTRPEWRAAATSAAIGAPPQPDGGWSHAIRTLENPLVQAPQNNALTTPSGVITATGDDVPEASLWRGKRRANTPFEAPANPDEEIRGTWLWGGTLWRYFAHFIVESPSRLWGIDQADEKLDGILFIPRRANKETDLTAFQTGFFNAFGIDLPIRVVEASARVERLIVPGQGFGVGEISAGTPAFRDFVHRRFGNDIKPDGGEKLYISRSGLGPNRGGLLGETRIEEELARQGYEIFHPQKHDMPTQIARYKAARKIIASEGSAVHFYAYAGHADQSVAIIPRRVSGSTMDIMRNVESFTGATTTVMKVLREVWQPTHSKRARLSVGEPDLPALQAALVSAGFIADGPTWAPLERSEITAALGKDYKPTGKSMLDG